jgi:hypothetical protein
MEWRRWIYAIPARLRAIVRVRGVERDLDDELAFHVAMQARANRERGMSETEAHRRARLAIGGVEQVKERSRDARTQSRANDLIQDIRYGLRSLWKTPRFTIAALLTVVLGVGANATIFNVLNPLLFKPLPYPEPDRIVNVFRTSPQSDRWPHSNGNYFDHRDRNTVSSSWLPSRGRTPAWLNPTSRRSACSQSGRLETTSRCLVFNRCSDARSPTPMIRPGQSQSWSCRTGSGNGDLPAIHASSDAYSDSTVRMPRSLASCRRTSSIRCSGAHWISGAHWR